MASDDCISQCLQGAGSARGCVSQPTLFGKVLHRRRDTAGETAPKCWRNRQTPETNVSATAKAAQLMRTGGLKVKEIKPKTKHRAGKGICNYKTIPSLLSAFALNSVRVKGRQVIGAAEFSPGSQPRPLTLLLEAWQALSMQSAERREWQAINILHSHGSSQVTEA